MHTAGHCWPKIPGEHEPPVQQKSEGQSVLLTQVQAPLGPQVLPAVALQTTFKIPQVACGQLEGVGTAEQQSPELFRVLEQQMPDVQVLLQTSPMFELQEQPSGKEVVFEH
ncbi:MAG: hypothetical protein WCK49_01505 [Myxococcaceae bacterium]